MSSSARDLIVASLSEQLPGVTVKAHAGPVEELTQDAVLVRLDSVRPAPELPRVYAYTGTLLAVAASTDEAAGDDDVDELLEDVLDVIVATPGVIFESAQRATLDDRWHAWEITVTYPLTRTPA